MKSKLSYALFALVFAVSPLWAEEEAKPKADAAPAAEAPADAAPAAAPAAKAPAAAEPAVGEGDDEWLNTVWTQVDAMVEEQEFELQETVTVAGVRGAEAEDNILAKLYYKGGKRYPSQDKLNKAIETLKKGLEKKPKSAAAPKQKFFIAQCYEKLGKVAEARDYYSQVVKGHPKTPFASKAQEKLAQMAAGN